MRTLCRPVQYACRRSEGSGRAHLLQCSAASALVLARRCPGSVLADATSASTVSSGPVYEQSHPVVQTRSLQVQSKGNSSYLCFEPAPVAGNFAWLLSKVSAATASTTSTAACSADQSRLWDGVADDHLKLVSSPTGTFTVGRRAGAEIDRPSPKVHVGRAMPFGQSRGVAISFGSSVRGSA